MLRAAETIVRTDVGRQRRSNEDSSYAGAPVFVVADGMGGAQAGEVASQMVVEAFSEGVPEQGTPEERLSVVIQKANREIHARSHSDAASAGMGTTVTAAYLDEDSVALAHVGDSRAYLLRDGALYQISEDHSLVAEMVRDGTLAPEEAAVSLHRHIITRALGLEEAIDPFILRDRLAAGDRFILCSDGLTDVVEPETIQEIVATMPPAEACQALVDAALAGGGPDNISVGVFAVDRRSAGR